MATTFGFFTDANLTSPLTSSLVSTQKADVSVDDPVVHQVWFGSLGSAGGNTTDLKVQAASNPGTDNVTLSIVASVGASHSVNEVKLALTTLPGDWSVVPAGAAISLGTEVLSGTANAKKVFIRVDDTTYTVSDLTELSVTTETLIETTN